MTGSSVLPVCLHKNKLYFLFGKENELESSAKGFSDFGGGVENKEKIFDTALREGGEELTGFLGDSSQLQKHIDNHGGVLKHVHEDKYHIHMFHLPYDPNLPFYYNNNHRFLWERMNKKMLGKTKLFEKIEIGWFTTKDIKKRIREFRPFYQEIILNVLKDTDRIRKFLQKNKRNGHNKTKKQNSIK